MKKFTALILFVIIVTSLFSSCRNSEYVMKYENKEVSVNYYRYWLSSYKARLLYYYRDIEDSEEFWNSKYSEGVTIDDFLTETVDNYIKNYLVSDYLCDKFDISLTDATIKEIDNQLNDILTEIGEGSVSKFNSYAAEFGVNFKMLRNIYIMEAKSNLVYDYLISNQIKDAVNDDVIEEYYQNNYCRIKHIYIATQFSSNFNENGEPIYDENGNYTKDYTEEEKAAKLARVSQLEAVLTKDNFADYVEEYNEDPAVNIYKNGFYLSANTDYDANVITAGLTMNTGEVRKVETAYGIYFVYKYELDKGAWSNEENSDFFGDMYDTVCDKLYNEMINGYFKDIEINEEAKRGISIKTVSPCSYF